ncbi:phage head closure protein [Aneurinibacillus sp. REN35]|uniref:phage head closure protein n=1 Tax=Aneurinibacillus sp. REN35 TaxID=3237286 RepID=UPI0035284BBA
MNPGKLNKRITLQRFEKTKDSEGIVTEAWNDVATVWASAEPLRGREYFAAAAVNQENIVRFRIRYRPGVTSEMRVVYGGRLFDIKSVIDVNERHRELQLMAEEVYGDGG